MDRKSVLEKYCLIPVGRAIALVDREDYERLRGWDWKLKKRANGSLCASMNYKGEAGFQVWYLHHAVCTRANGPRPGPDYLCEAINGDSLDCRRENLRWRTKLSKKLEAMHNGRLRARANA